MNVAVAIIAIKRSQVLLVQSRKRPGSVEIPGGALLPGESRVHGAVRELREECGLYVDSWNLVPFQTKETPDWRVHIFQALRWSGQLTPGDDASECFFGPPDWLLEGAHPEDYTIVSKAIHQHKAAFG